MAVKSLASVKSWALIVVDSGGEEECAGEDIGKVWKHRRGRNCGGMNNENNESIKIIIHL